MLLPLGARVHSEETDKKGCREPLHHHTAEPGFDPVLSFEMLVNCVGGRPNQDI